MPGADDCTALRHRRERARHEFAHRSKDDGGVEQLGGRLVRSAGPRSAEGAGELLAGLVPRSGEAIDLPATIPGDLNRDVGGRPESVETDPLGGPGETEGPEPDHPGAQERRRLDVPEPGRDPEHEPLVGDDLLGVPSVPVVSGEHRAVAQILAPGSAERAAPAGPP